MARCVSQAATGHQACVLYYKSLREWLVAIVLDTGDDGGSWLDGCSLTPRMVSEAHDIGSSVVVIGNAIEVAITAKALAKSLRRFQPQFF